MKIKLEQEAKFDPTFLSVMDTVFMLFYAIGSFFSGTLGDLLPAPMIVSIGLFGSSLCIFTLAIFVWISIETSENELWRTFLPLLVWLIHGLFQSTGGPSNTSIMSSWFGYKHRGYIFGTWTCHQYVGNIIAALLASLVLAHPALPWTAAFVIPAIVDLLWAMVVLYGLPERPQHVPGLREVVHQQELQQLYEQRQMLHQRQLQQQLRLQPSTLPLPSLVPAANAATAAVQSTAAASAYLTPAPTLVLYSPTISLLEAIRIPHVIGYILAFGCFKFVNYSLFFWLPFYLSSSAAAGGGGAGYAANTTAATAGSFSPAYSNLLSILYDVGMLPGGILVGVISDIYGGRRACVIATFTIALLPFLWYLAEHDGQQPDGRNKVSLPAILVILTIMGMLIGGPINIITSAVAVDLSEHSAIGGRNDLMTVTGLINGTGSIMAALGLAVVGPLVTMHGWRLVWYLLAASTLLGTCLLYPIIRKELLSYYYQHYQLSQHHQQPLQKPPPGTEEEDRERQPDEENIALVQQLPSRGGSGGGGAFNHRVFSNSLYHSHPPPQQLALEERKDTSPFRQ